MNDLQWFYDHGINLIPLKPGTKIPATSGNWRKSHYSKKRIEAYLAEGCNVGAVIPRGKLVLDVDARNGGIESLCRLNSDLKLGMDIQKLTPTSLTAGGGFHIWLDTPFEMRTKGKMPERYPGIDLKGHGGYVVAPGSVVKDHKYEWTRSSVENGVVEPLCLEIPENLVKHVRKRAMDETSTADPGELDAADVHLILSSIDPTLLNHNHEDWIHLMMACHHATNGCPIAREEFIEWSAQDPEYDSEVIREQNRYRWTTLQVDGGITVGSLFHHARNLCDNYDVLRRELFGDVLITADDFEDFLEEDEAGELIEKLPFGINSFHDMRDMDFTVEYLVEDVLVQGSPMLISGVSKACKTTIAMDLAFSLTAGTPFLGKYKVNKRQRTLFLIGETEQGVTREKIQTMEDQYRWGCQGCRSGEPCFRGEHTCCEPHRVADDWDQFLFLGNEVPKIVRPTKHVPKAGGVDDLIRVCKLKQIEVLIIDPAYLALPSEESNNLLAQGELLRSLNETIKEMGVTLILLHHNRKTGSIVGQDPPNIFDMSGAGFGEFARQWILSKRIEDYKSDGVHKLHFVTGGSAGHSEQTRVYINEGVKPRGADLLFGDEEENENWRRWEVSWSGDVFKDLEEEDELLEMDPV